MKHSAAILLLVMSTTIAAAPHRRAAAIGDGELRIVFANGAVDLGVIRNTSRNHAAVIETTVTIRVERAGVLQGGVASLRAAVAGADPRIVVRVDGMRLDTLPRLVDARMPLGATRTHRVTVEVPRDVPAGAITSSIVWDATSE